MPLLYVILISLTHGADDSVIYDERTEWFSQMCMYRVVGLLHPGDQPNDLDPSKIEDIRRILQPNFPILKKNPCRWIGVSCIRGYSINIVEWNLVARWGMNVPLKHIYHRWLPPTLTQIRFKDYVNEYMDPFEAAYLPKDSITVGMIECGLLGTVDTGKLPKNLEELELPYNRIQGTVSLDNLPDTLKLIDLRVNPIDTLYVNYDTLPSEFQNGYFSSIKRRRIHTVKTEKVDGRIKFSR